jgi:hypothetical protein
MNPYTCRSHRYYQTDNIRMAKVRTQRSDRGKEDVSGKEGGGNSPRQRNGAERESDQAAKIKR